MSSRLKKLLMTATGFAAASLNLGKVAVKQRPAFTVTNKAGKPGTHYRRIVRHEVRGPFHRQVGWRWRNGECIPIMRTITEHRYYHATKGWRCYTRGLPAPGVMRRPVHNGRY